MNRSQIILSVAALALVVILYQLPRVVVENDQLQEVAESSETHGLAIPEDVRARMLELRRLLKEEENLDKKTNFAHSLARYYLDYGVLDSATMMAEAMSDWQSQPSMQAMDVYYKAFERAQTQTDAKKYSERAREIIEQLMDKDPSNLELKNKLAMTLVTTENPMAGIAMLREVLEVDANNRQAVLSLGLLAIQSGQFARAKERFDKLLSLDTSDQEARLYLAVSMIEINEQEKAIELLEEILSSKDSIPAIKMMADDYLKGL